MEHTRQIKTFSLQAGMPNTLKALVDRVREYLETLPRWVYTRSRDQIAREIIWQIHHDKTLQYKRTEEAIRMCLSLVRKERYATPIGIASGMALTTESYQELMA